MTAPAPSPPDPPSPIPAQAPSPLLEYRSPPRQLSRWAVSSLVLGALAVPLMLIFVGLIFAMGAVFCAESAFDDIRQDASIRGRPFAVAGMTLGLLCCGGAIVAVSIALIREFLHAP